MSTRKEKREKAEAKRGRLAEIKKTIRENKPNLGDSTLNTYCSIVEKYAGKVGSLDFEAIAEELLKEYKADGDQKSKFRTAASAIFSYFAKDKEDAGKLKVKLDELINNVNSKEREFYSTGEFRSEEEAKEYLPWEEIMEVLNTASDEIKEIFNEIKKRGRHTEGEFDTIKAYLALVLQTRLVRRSTDWIQMKIRKGNPEKDNVVNSSKKGEVTFTFNVYKTAKHYGRQVFKENDDALRVLIEKYKSMTPSDQEYMFVTRTGKQLGSSSYGALLNYFFKGTDKKLTTNTLRKSYATHLQKQFNVKEIARKMGTSEGMLTTAYNKVRGEEETKE